jgi:hypothetical protein
MPYLKTLALLAITVVPCVFADIAVERHGRRVQVDGFLLEWDSKDANRWGGSGWSWDAINTAEGVAGYFSSKGGQACSSWVFNIDVANTGKVLSIKIPEQRTTDFFAFDKGSFDNDGTHTVEWIVPWSVFETDGGNNASDNGGNDAYPIILNAASDCGDTLAPLRLSVIRENMSSAPPFYYIIVTVSVLIAIIVVGFIAVTRKQKRRRHTAT